MARSWSCQRDVVTDIMTRTDGMYPFYRQALQHVPLFTLMSDVNQTFGSVVRQDYALWRHCPHNAIDVSQQILLDVWKRLG